MQETQETWVCSMGQEDPLKEQVAMCSSILAWKIPWTEESGGLQSIESQRVGQNRGTEHTLLIKERIRVKMNLTIFMFPVTGTKSDTQWCPQMFTKCKN